MNRHTSVRPRIAFTKERGELSPRRPELMQKFTKDVLWVGIAFVVVNMQNLLFIPIITKHFDASSYGIWTQVMVTVNLLVLVATMRLEMAERRFVLWSTSPALTGQLVSSMILSVALVATVMATGMMILANPLAYLIFGTSEAQPFIRPTALLVMFTALILVNTTYFLSVEKIRVYAWLLILQAILEISAVFLGVTAFDFELLHALYTLIFMRGVFVCIAIFLVSRNVELSFAGFANHSLLAFSLPLIFSGAFFYLFKFVDRYLVTGFLGTGPVGIYAAAYGISSLPAFIVAPVSSVLLSTLSRELEQGHHDRIKALLSSSLKWYALLAIPIAVGIVALGDSIVRLFGSEEILSAKLLLPILLGGTVLHGVHVLQANVFLLLKRTRTMTLLVGISLAANVAINLVLVPSWRLRGAAVATLIAYVILVALMFGFGQRMLSYRVNLLAIAKMGAASAVMGLVVAYLQSMHLPIVVLVPTGFAIYMVLITAMRVVKVSELVVIWHAAAFWKG